MPNPAKANASLPQPRPARTHLALKLLTMALMVAAITFAWLKLNKATSPTTATIDQPQGPIKVNPAPPRDIPQHYVGYKACAECHKEEAKQWRGSKHDRAMEPASIDTILGDFNNATFEHFGITSNFYRKDDGFYVHTEGPHGQMKDFKIAYTFGLYPLQQYLVEFPNGKLQTLGLSWDSRPESEGGQRWFHIHQHERITHADPLYWTRPLQNWNMQCAACHSTNLQKNYQPETDSYSTTFSEINVSCEACHGPGSEHVRWAHTREDIANKGLTNLLKQEPFGWRINPETQLPERTTPLQSHAQIETCANCHSRRDLLVASHIPGDHFMDSHRPMLLEPSEYEVDGRIRGEVFAWGSFVQSKMYHAGVQCTDCHNAHNLKLRAPIAQLCIQCHQAETYNTPEHHFHPPLSSGASCVNCHMPTETYMVVDPRRDHRFSIPRPDLSLTMATPNACNDCHTDQNTQWAADHFINWFGKPKEEPNAFTLALFLEQQGHPLAAQHLIAAIKNDANPPITRATMLARLDQFPSEQALDVIRRMIADQDPLIRMGAVRALAPYPPAIQWQYGGKALGDQRRAVRVEAARILASAAAPQTLDRQSRQYQTALKELQNAIKLNSDWPGTILENANLQLALGYPPESAVKLYHMAIKREPGYVPTYVNLAEIYRQAGNADKEMQTLELGLQAYPEAAVLHYAIAMANVRNGDMDAAMESINKARQFEPENPDYIYIRAVALHSTGNGIAAIEQLREGLELFPNHEQLLIAMATISRDHDEPESAEYAARHLTELDPDNPQFQQLLQSIRQMQPNHTP